MRPDPRLGARGALPLPGGASLLGAHLPGQRPAAQVERLARAIRRGQIEMTALFGNQTTELCGHEEMIRALYPAFELKHRLGIEIQSAEHNDIAGFSLGPGLHCGRGWGALLFAGRAAVGTRRGTPERVHPLWDEARVLDMDVPGAFWWEGIDGSRVLLW